MSQRILTDTGLEIGCWLAALNWPFSHHKSRVIILVA